MAAMVIGVRYCNNDHLQRYPHLQGTQKGKMEYTKIVLFLLKAFGIVLHNLIKLDGINRQKQREYKSVEILAHGTVQYYHFGDRGLVCLIPKQEVKQLQQVGNWKLGLAFVAIILWRKSIVVSLWVRLRKIINDTSMRIPINDCAVIVTRKATEQVNKANDKFPVKLRKIGPG